MAQTTCFKKFDQRCQFMDLNNYGSLRSFTGFNKTRQLHGFARIHGKMHTSRCGIRYGISSFTQNYTQRPQTREHCIAESGLRRWKDRKKSKNKKNSLRKKFLRNSRQKCYFFYSTSDCVQSYRSWLR